MSADKKINELKITYIGQASLDREGMAGAARVKNMVCLFKKIGIKTDHISYSLYSTKFNIEHKK